ncbi:hypothetical protein Bsp3421_005929 [Burkholderia sp. FERM BP-3421]|uniref:hypothetical protein n=1 Tax=Burkholderia sp. FERM BP-3421 TaxID=1494466 RepID=UPI0023627E79|nr:hypothetical protein [Burkholderia sp. FERM BP-3421]WDD95749.1 hypothetical protein Bsp3421_005929 [Burkholderia sp. FERM BP-3421]
MQLKRFRIGDRWILISSSSKVISNGRKEPDELDGLIENAAARSKNRRRLAMQTKRGRQFEKSRGYIPLSVVFEGEGFRRNFEMEKRSAHGNPELIRELEEELACNATSYAETKVKRRKAASQGGKATASVRQAGVTSVHDAIVKYACQQLEKGKKPHELASITARNFRYSDRRVRDILKSAGVIKKKNGNAP